MLEAKQLNFNIRDLLLSAKSSSGFLEKLIHEKKQRNPRYSLRSFAKKLGYNNPSLISDVISGRKPMSPNLANRLIDSESLYSLEKRYLLNMIEIESNKTASDIDNIIQENCEIEKYWRIDFYSGEGLASIDLIIVEYLQFKKGVSEKDLFDTFEASVSHPILNARLEYLVENKIIFKDDNHNYVYNEGIGKFSLDLKSHGFMIPLLEKTLQFEKNKNHVMTLTGFLDDQDYKKAKEILIDAGEQVVMLCLEADRKKHTENRKLRTLFSSFFTID